VEEEISESWAGQQGLVGPILAVPYKVVLDSKAKQIRTTQQVAYILPQQYHVDGNLIPKTLYRGIYEANIYTSTINIYGNFSTKPIEELKIPKENILWNRAHVILAISSTKGIEDRLNLKWKEQTIELLPGLHDADFLGTGLSAPVPVTAEKSTIPFQINLSLKGSQALSIAPIGGQNNINLQSTWASPSFVGNSLPKTRSVNSKGFFANWQIPYFARDYGQLFLSTAPIQEQIQASSIGVQLLTPVDAYRQSERAVKYGVLFLVLTFATYFLFEVISSSRLHPFQYLLIGCAISLFYLLLIAISEVIRFELAYGLASAAIISTITLYSSAILGRIRKHAQFIIGGLLTLLYSYLYILLQLEDQSLLFGSIGLFIVLAVIMYITRNIDWYNEQGES
jgi:inner membrane protein